MGAHTIGPSRRTMYNAAMGYPIHDSGSEETSSIGYLEKCPKPDGRLDRHSANNDEVADPTIMSNLWAGKAGIK